jgi:hypothetical protein
MGPFDILLARIALGERYQKATAADWRFGLAVLLWFTSALVVVPFAQSFIDQASVFIVWLCLTLWLVAGWAFAEFSKRYVPAIIPVVIVVIAWTLHFLL